MNEKKFNFRVTFPPLTLYFVFAAVCSVVKSLGGTSRDWIDVILTIPSTLYFGWTFGFCVCFALAGKLNKD